MTSADPTRPATISFHRRASRGLFVVLPLCFAACRDDHVVAYSVPKENVAPPPGAAVSAPQPSPAAANAGAPDTGMVTTPVATSAGPGLAWTAPAHWQSKPGNAMRKGSYAINGEGGLTADLSITAFPGDVGGEVANVNRWRGQIGLTPLADADVASAVTRSSANGLTLNVVDFANLGAATPIRIVGAMVPHEGATWFFKLMGPDALVAKEKPSFLEFLKTVKPAAPAAP